MIILHVFNFIASFAGGYVIGRNALRWLIGLALQDR